MNESRVFVARNGKQVPAGLYFVTVERTYVCDFVVAATNQAEARMTAERDCDPRDGDFDVTASVIREIKCEDELPHGLTMRDEPDTAAQGIGWKKISEFLGPQETPEEKEIRLHNEAMAKLQGALF